MRAPAVHNRRTIQEQHDDDGQERQLAADHLAKFSKLSSPATCPADQNRNAHRAETPPAAVLTIRHASGRIQQVKAEILPAARLAVMATGAQTGGPSTGRLPKEKPTISICRRCVRSNR